MNEFELLQKYYRGEALTKLEITYLAELEFDNFARERFRDEALNYENEE